VQEKVVLDHQLQDGKNLPKCLNESDEEARSEDDSVNNSVSEGASNPHPERASNPHT